MIQRADRSLARQAVSRLSKWLYDPVALSIFVRPCAGARRTASLCVGRWSANELHDEVQQTMTAAGQWDGSEIARRRARCDECFAVFHGGRCVSYIWSTRERRQIEEVRLRADLPNGEYWLYNAFTVPTHRNRGLYSRLLEHAVSVLSDAGGRLAWIDAERGNHASIRGILRAGFAEVARVDRASGLLVGETEPHLTALNARWGKHLRLFGEDFSRHCA